MNQAHFHLILTHIPIMGILFGILILLAGIILKNKPVRVTALYVLFGSALMAVPTFFSGEGAEEMLENYPNVSHQVIERHEELASIFIWVVGALGILSLITSLAEYRGWKSRNTFYLLTGLAALAAMAFAKPLGTSGGEIRHTEIKTAAVDTQRQNLDSPAQQDYQYGEEEDD